MISGPDNLYQCMECGHFLKAGSVLSSAGIGEILFSDGKRIHPLLLVAPEITRCRNCGKFLWLNRLKKLVSNDWNDSWHDETKKISQADYLDVYDYLEYLKTSVINDIEEEKIIRLYLWWSFNDRVRKGEPMFNLQDDEEYYTGNLNRLLQLLNKNDWDERIVIAEIYRNLGDFIKCIEILSAIKNKRLAWIKLRLLKECQNSNKLVVRLI